jgi:hypothetical protein
MTCAHQPSVKQPARADESNHLDRIVSPLLDTRILSDGRFGGVPCVEVCFEDCYCSSISLSTRPIDPLGCSICRMAASVGAMSLTEILWG